MTVDDLNLNFALPGVLHFEEDAARGHLPVARVTLPDCTATVFLHGAHLAEWQPAGFAPALFLSDRSEFAEGKAIRGGIPICFPWFGARTFAPDGQIDSLKTAPSHGFARLLPWEVGFAALVPGHSGASADTLHLSFNLRPGEFSRSFGYGTFAVAYEMIFGADAGRTLTLRLSVANPGEEPFAFEEAMHTYCSVANVAETTLSGVESATYLDKTDGLKQKQAPATPLYITGQTDRVFPGHRAATVIHDSGNSRQVTISKQNSLTTIVWNPWTDIAATLKDLEPGAWRTFLCVETANAGADRITLAPGEAHTMECSITLQCT